MTRRQALAKTLQPVKATTSASSSRKPKSKLSLVSSSSSGGDDENVNPKKKKLSNSKTDKPHKTRKIKSDPILLPQKPATKRQPVQCWALKRCGTRCATICKPREGEPIPIPYCDKHLQDGADYALQVVDHPIADKCLVARYDLPKNYRMVFFGNRGKCPTSDKEDRSISYYPPNPTTGSNLLPGTRTLKRNNYNGVLNPKDTADVLQYAACPGPNERQNIRSTFRYWGVRNGEVGGLEFVTLEEIPKHTMLLHWYGQGWWEARNIQRIDVGLPQYPAPLRRGLMEEK